MERFINDYVEYASGLSASPKKFHRMMAYAMLAQVIGRRPLYQKNGPTIGPNLWMLVLAPSSTMAKSSALAIGRRILTKAYFDSHDYLLPVGGSSENLFERLQENPSGIFLSSEFCNLVNWFKLHYANDVSSLIIDAYDQPLNIYKSIGTNHKGNKKNYHIKNPFLNAYAVSSYDLFNSVINHSLLTGGFLVRWLMIREDSEDNYRAFTEPIDEMKEVELGEQLKTILQDQGLNKNFEYDERGAKTYSEWFNDYLKPTIKDSGHFFIPPYCQRRVADLHKISMIHAVTRHSDGVMNFYDVDTAICIIQESIKDAIFLIENKISMSKDEAEWNRVFEYIKRFQNGSSGAPKWKVMKYSKLPSFQFDRHIQTLQTMNKIEIINENKKHDVYFKTI